MAILALPPNPLPQSIYLLRYQFGQRHKFRQHSCHGQISWFPSNLDRCGGGESALNTRIDFQNFYISDLLVK